MTELLERTCKLATKQLEKIVESAEHDGKMPIQDAEFIDYLTHTIKSVKTTLAMEGYGTSERRGRDSMGRFTSRDGGYEGSGYYPMWRGAWDDGGGSMRGSYERSMHGDEREKIERMIRDTDDERVKRALTEAMRNI